MMHYLPLVVAAAVSAVSMRIILSSQLGDRIKDIPNARSLHVTPIPRIGGVAIMIGVAAGIIVQPSLIKWWWLLPLLILFGISILDDIYSQPVMRRLLAQMAAAIILIFGADLQAKAGWPIAILVILSTVWMTNLYNFMDGSDGLAGGMALIGFASYGSAAYISNQLDLATLSFVLSAAALGFLSKNFPPAKVFMGDSGSVPLGFMAAALGIWGWGEGGWAAWFPLLVFSPFIVDASATLLKRILNGAKAAEAHREHYYQRVIQMGWSHRNVALAEYFLMLGCGISGVCCIDVQFPWQILLGWLVIYAALMLKIDMEWKKYKWGQHASN